MQCESMHSGYSLINLSSLILQREYAGYILRKTYHIIIADVKITVLTNQIP